MKLILSVFFIFSYITLQAQTNQQTAAGLDSVKKTEKISGAFKSTRVINAHSIEMLHKGNLDFRILHRFGFVDAGIKQLFGLDQASMRLGFDYGISDNFTVGLGRSTYRKEIDLFGKWRILQQSRGSKNMPLSLVLTTGAMTWTEQSFAVNKPDFSDRTSFYVQLLAGRKITKNFSVQISPIWVHSNMPLSGIEKDIVSIGGGIRYKFSGRMAFIVDYHHVLNGLTPQNTNPLSLGIDIETGGHIFQLHFSNATGMNERAYITETYGKFFKGEIRFGFNLSRMFRLTKRR